MVQQAAGDVLTTTQSFHKAYHFCREGCPSRSEASQNSRKGSLRVRKQDIVLPVASISRKDAHHRAHQTEKLLIIKDDTLETRQDGTNDATAIVALLQACIKNKDLRSGRRIHDEIVKRGLLEKHPFLGNALLTMYTKCGDLEKAQELFNHLSFRTVVSWNALIAAYAHYGHVEKAFTCFKRMQSEGFSPNAVTFICVLKACGCAAGLDKALEVHSQVSTDLSLTGDIHVGTALVDMYVKNGLLAKAQEVFDELPAHNLVTWTALIGGYVQHGYDEEALSYFDQMESLGFSPNAVTYVCILKACGSIGALHKGQEIHSAIMTDGVKDLDMVVHTALVNMYADCGMLAEAQDVFDNSHDRDIVVWNALLGGYAQFGKDESIFKLFDKMIQEGKVPSFATFTILLNVCSHIGLLAMSQRYFDIISNGYGMLPTLEHHACMVDLLGRTGHLEKAVMMIKGMPFPCNATLWNTLLGACGNWANVELGRRLFEHALRLNQVDTRTHICMRNIHAAASSRRQDTDKVEALRAQMFVV